MHPRLLPVSLLAFVSFSPALFAADPPRPQVSLRSGTAPGIGVEWTDNSEGWTLEVSRDLKNWAHLDASGYEVPQAGNFRFTEEQDQASFYRLRKTGTSAIYVVGDSISTPGAWPSQLAAVTGKNIFSQAIGGTRSPSMVSRARGVELIAPSPAPTTPGRVHMRWQRHLADRTYDPLRGSEWAYYSKAVSEPMSIEVYQHGRFLGLAKRILKPFTTDYATYPKTIFCAGHGLKEKDNYVTFISDDPNYPSDLAVTDSTAAWNFSSLTLPKLVIDSSREDLTNVRKGLPGAMVERKVYFATNITTNSFELKELTSSTAATLSLASNATGSPSIECGWEFDVDFAGGTWDVTWAARTKYDDRIWLLEVSANDIPDTNLGTVTFPNTLLLLKQMTEINPRFLLVCPPAGSFSDSTDAAKDRGPGTFAWNNYYNTFMPWVRANFPDNYIDMMAVLESYRTAKELAYLSNPNTPERVWISTDSKPTVNSTWVVYKTATAGTYETWIGPGFIPMHFRSGFNDDIHPNVYGNQAIANAVAAKLTEKGW